LATDRCRINLSVPNPIYAALESSAKKLGMSPASIALAALMAYIPTIQVQLDALEEMAS
jgi:gamma-glutamylcysteine synthetase